MAFRAQIAFGKNITLQKQLDRRFVDFKKSFKSSRRRQDALEEECVSSLYKLLLDSKSKQDERARVASAASSRTASRSTGPKRPHSVFEICDEKIPDPRRSQTSMSVHSYVQSYSFKQDGLDIGRNRRDRFIKTRKEKQEDSHTVQIEKRKRPGSSARTEVEFKRKLDLIEQKDDTVSERPIRPKTAEPKLSESPYQKSALKRPNTRNTLTPSQISFHSSTAFHEEQQIDNQQEASPIANEDICLQIPQKGHKQTIHVGVSSHNEDDKPHIQVRIKAFLANERVSTPELPCRYVTEYNREDDTDVELLPLTDEEKLQLGGYDDGKATDKERQRSGLARNQLEASSEQLLEKSAERTQSFLTDYAKKSKLFGYVVKTRSSAVAPRDHSKKSYRSPAISYQELVSIKANIKQHETRTRFLLQKSAKLSKYVDTLVTAADMRQHKADMVK